MKKKREIGAKWRGSEGKMSAGWRGRDAWRVAGRREGRVPWRGEEEREVRADRTE